MKSQSLIFFSLFLLSMLLHPCCSISAEAELILRNNLKQALPGEYLVIAQNKNYTALIIRSKENDNLSIEEITVPSQHICSEKNFSWRQWILGGAQGNSSWIMYNINLSSGNIQQAFSFSRNEWITVSQSQNFLSTLLNLHLKEIPERERKKIGPRPASDTTDRRSFWQPALIFEGKAVAGVRFDAWRTKWPKDSSELAGKMIEVYLPHDKGQYPTYFPYWLQISGMIGKAKVRIIDSGINLTSPAKAL